MSEDLGRYLARLAEILRTGDAPREVRVAVVRRRFRGERMRVLGQVWRLGALCLDEQGALFATGEALAVKAPTHPNYRSEIALRRNALFMLAQRSGIAPGTTIVLDAVVLDVANPTAPLVPLAGGETGGEMGVEWMRGASPVPLRSYLDERADLLLHPLPQSGDEG